MKKSATDVLADDNDTITEEPPVDEFTDDVIILDDPITDPVPKLPVTLIDDESTTENSSTTAGESGQQDTTAPPVARP